MKILRLAVVCGMTVMVSLAGCAKKNTSKISVEGPKNKYEVKLEKSEKVD